MWTMATKQLSIDLDIIRKQVAILEHLAGAAEYGDAAGFSTQDKNDTMGLTMMLKNFTQAEHGDILEFHTYVVPKEAGTDG